MRRAFVVVAVIAFVVMTVVPAHAQWWGKKAKKDKAEKTAEEVVPAVQEVSQEPVVAESTPPGMTFTSDVEPVEVADEITQVQTEGMPEAVPQPTVETPIVDSEPAVEIPAVVPEPAVIPKPIEKAPMQPPVKERPRQEVKPATQAPQPAPVVSESEAKRVVIADALASGDTKRGFDELKGVLRNQNKYHPIKEWATLELMNRAQARGELAIVTKDLEAAAGTNYDNVILQRAVAEGYLRQRDFNKVISIYEGLEKSDPKDYVIATRLTDYYILGKQFNKAIERLEPIVNANPDDDYHSDILLNAYVQAGIEDKAMAIFKRRLEKEPKSPGLRARYAQALQDFGRVREAAAEWEKAAQLDPKNAFFGNRASEIRAKVK